MLKNTVSGKIFSLFHGSAQNKLKNYIFMLFMADWDFPSATAFKNFSFTLFNFMDLGHS
jgi:hypothetical protein